MKMSKEKVRVFLQGGLNERSVFRRLTGYNLRVAVLRTIDPPQSLMATADSHLKDWGDQITRWGAACLGCS